MQTVILGMCAGYAVPQIEMFAKTCREFYSGRVVLFLSNCADDVEPYLRSLGIETVDAGPLKKPALDRFYRWHDFLLNDTGIERCLMTDVRDVLFQADPFAGFEEDELRFFEEPISISANSPNRSWIQSIYGERQAQELETKSVICCGTIIASRKGALTYLQQFLAEVDRVRPLPWGTDQAVTIKLIYSGAFPQATIVKNGCGEVQTLARQERFVFNARGNLLNADGTKPAIVHQYDRHDFLVRHFDMTPRDLRKFKKLEKSRSAAFKHLINVTMSKGLG